MDSDFYFDVNGEILTLLEDLNIISGEASKQNLTGHVIIIPNQNLSIKHAIIKIIENQECEIMDICSGITIKNALNAEEKLIPMKWYKMNAGQSVIFGKAVAVLKKSNSNCSQEVIDASPNAETVKSRYLFNNRLKTASSFQEVPATEDLLGSEHHKLTQENVYIPETQTMDEILTQKYETDSYQINQDSQLNLSELHYSIDSNRELLDTFHENLISKENFIHSNNNDRDGSITPELRLEDFTSVVVKQEPLTQIYEKSDVATQLFPCETVRSTRCRQSDIATQLFPCETVRSTRCRQSDIATQLFIEPKQDPAPNDDSLYSCETQQLVLKENVVKTRKRAKEESLKISKIESIAVFDIATQPMIAKPINKHIYDVATQVVDVSHMFESPVHPTKKSVRNRIFDSSDEDNEDDNTPVKSISISQEDNTPEFIPRFNTGSQMDRDIAEVNLSQNSDEEFSFLINNEDSDREEVQKCVEHPVRPKMKQEVVKKTNSRKNLMKFADSDFAPTPNSVKKSDSTSRLISKRRDSLRSSGSQTLKEPFSRNESESSDSPTAPINIIKRRNSTRTLDPPVKEPSISKRRNSVRSSALPTVKEPSISKRRDSVPSKTTPSVKEPSSNNISESSPPVSTRSRRKSSTNGTKRRRKTVDTPAKKASTSRTEEAARSSKSHVKESSSTKTIVDSTRTSSTTRSGVKTRSSKSPPSLPPAKEKSTKPLTRNKSQDLNLKRPLAENVLKNNRAKRQCPEVIPDPQYIVAVTNFAERSKIVKLCNIMGFQLNDEIMLANVLISNDKIKFTSKFLAAMCKGIPIVTFAWLDQCYKHKKALNPVDFIILDKECEQSKRFSMKKVLQRSDSAGFLKNYSVYVTPNTKPLFAELNNILQCAGAECLDLSQKASNHEVIGIANQNDTKEIKELKKRFGSRFKILQDSSVCEVVIHQKLIFNHKCPW